MAGCLLFDRMVINQHNKIDDTVTEQESVRHTVVYFTTGDEVGQGCGELRNL
jgi:hypothetical protein